MAKFTGHPITDDSALGGSIIGKSLRIDQGTADTNSGSNYSRTFASGNRKTFTISLWVKKSDTPGNIGDGDDQYSIFTCGGGGTGAYSGGLKFGTSDQLIWVNTQPAPTAHAKLETNRKFRDPSAWYHIMFVADTTQGTDSNRLKLYVNGVQETDFANTTYPSQNYDLYFNLNVRHRIGSNSIWSDLDSTYGNFNGYFAEFHFLDGTAYDPSYFGYTESQTGLWRPKKYTSGNYGTNGFYLDFSDNTNTTTLGLDKSGQGNNFTPEDVSVSAGAGNDSLEDTPTNNYPTLNSYHKNNSGTYNSTGTIVNGALAHSSVGSVTNTYASIALPTVGQYYWEVRMSSINSASLGIMEAGGNINRSVLYNNDGTITQDNASAQSGLGAWSNTDIIGISYYADDTTISPTSARIQFYRNGSAQGSSLTLTTWTNPYIPFSRINAYADFNFGQRPFDYTPPTGFGKLSARDIIPVSPVIIRPQKHFDTILYTGNDGSQTITGLEFDPDFVWAKNRQDNGYHHDLYDTVRGNNLRIFSSQNQGEATGYLQFGVTGGFSLTSGGGINSNNKNHVAWCWKAGGAAVTNNDGNITSSVSVNEEAGFSIVSYTGNGSNGQTVGHGLSKAPQWIMLKNRDATQNWRVWQHKLASDGSKRLILDANNVSQDAGFLNDTAPTSTVFTLGNADDAWNANGDKFIVYCWHEVPGFSKFGSYTGNGSADGTYVHLGFQADFIMVKSSSLETNWNIVTADIDGYNVVTKYLDANTSSAEGTYTFLDVLSNGFKARNVGNSFNQSGASYIYMAFAKQPVTTPFATFPNSR